MLNNRIYAGLIWTFTATPHRGSSYLSMPDFSNRITQIMKLSRSLPMSIASQLHLNNNTLLRALDTDFKAIATDLHIWTFFETIDSDLTNPDLVESERFPFHAPITSIKFALLHLRHEVVYSLLSNHQYPHSLSPQVISRSIQRLLGQPSMLKFRVDLKLCQLWMLLESQHLSQLLLLDSILIHTPTF